MSRFSIRALLSAALLTTPLAGTAAQSLTGNTEWRVGVLYEAWHFGSGTLENLDRATQTSIPIIGVARFGPATVDLYTAYAKSTVHFRDGSQTHLDGLTDVKLRGTWRLPGENWLLTAGVTVPTGKTKLTEAELNAVRVLGAPSLRFQTPALGNGFGGLGGVVYTTHLAGWSWGFAASYEFRGTFEPVEAASLGFTTLDLKPSNTLRFSVGTDGIVGQTAMSFNVSSTMYGTDKLNRSITGVGSATDRINLGPAVTGEWRWRVPAPGFREVTLFAYDRYRSSYTRGSDAHRVAGTSGNEFEGGASGAITMSPALVMVTGLSGRYHSGLAVDNLVSTSAIVTGGGRVGLAYTAAGLVFQPAVGGEIGRMNTGGHTLSVNKLLLSMSVGAR